MTPRRFTVGTRSGIRTARQGVVGLVLLLTAAMAMGQEVYVTAEVEPLECRLGDEVRYHVYATVPNNVTRKLVPHPPDFAGFDRHGEPEVRQTDQAEQTVFSWTWRLRATRVGSVELAPFTASYTDLRDGLEHTAKTERLTVRVLSSHLQRDIRGDKPPVEVPSYSAPYLLAFELALGVLLVALAWVLIAWYRESRAARILPEMRPSPPPPADPRMLALRRLSGLEAKDLPGRGEVDGYHVELSDIVREYLAGRFKVSAVESTTSEIAAALYDRGVTTEQIALCRRVLYGCDLEKFAAYLPGRTEMDELLLEARRLIDLTTPGLTRPPEEVA